MEQITVVRAKDLVTEKLREAIYTGQFRPGDELIQQRISEQLGVSRMPVREAFAVLERAGMVEVLPNKHVMVRKITPEMIYEDLDLRTMLERMAVKKATLRSADFLDLERLNDAMKECVGAGKQDLFKDLNSRFHRRIWEKANSLRLLRMLEELWFAMPSYYPVDTAENGERNVREHSEILKRMQERRADEAADAMERHIAHTRARILDLLDPGQGLRGASARPGTGQF